MNLPGKRLLLGTAYAAGNDPVPDHGYVTIEDDATTPSPGTNGYDCPEKKSAPSQSSPEKSSPSQSTPDQSAPEQSDVQGQA